jgi:hypothetical protein
MLRQLHVRVLCITTIYALHLQESAALLQSSPLSRSVSTSPRTWACTRTRTSSTITTGTGSSSIRIPTECYSTNYNTNTLKEQEYVSPNVNDPQLFKMYPLTKPESASWAFQQNLDGRYALTHSLFREVASHLRSSTAPNGSRAACLPFLMKRDAGNIDGNVNVPIIEFTCDDLESALASDYLDACTGRSRNTSNCDENGDSDSTSSNDEQQGGWRMEGLGSTDTTSTINSNNLNSNEKHSQEHSFQSKRLHWNSVLDAQNTVVFNSAGAHISSQLAPTSLAALHGLNGAATGVCLNLYVTKSDL